MNKILLTLAAVLIALLPVQTILVYFAVNKLGLPIYMALWKEAVTTILLGIMLIKSVPKLQFLAKRKKFNTIIKIIFPLVLFTFLTIIITFNSLVLNQVNFNIFVLGFRFELWWVGVFSVVWLWFQDADLKLIPTNSSANLQNKAEYSSINADEVISHASDRTNSSNQENFSPKIFLFLEKLIYASFVFVTIFSLLSLIIDPAEMFARLGFVQNEKDTNSLLISPKVVNPIDHKIKSIRLSGGFSSPNHFAAYLLLILPIFVVNAFFINSNSKLKKILSFTLALLGSIFIFLTYSRFAWLSLPLFWLYPAFHFIHAAVQHFLNQRKNLKSEQSLPDKNLIEKPEKRDFIISEGKKENTSANKKILAKSTNFTNFLIKSLVVCTLVGTLGAGIFGLMLTQNKQLQKVFPKWLVKRDSTNWHYKYTMIGLEIVKDTPEIYLKGLGLGVSGNVVKQEYQDRKQNYIVRNYRYLANKYVVNPLESATLENWFLQVLINGGLLYFLIYCILVFLPLSGIWDFLRSRSLEKTAFISLTGATGFYGVILGNVFLHVWESQTTALYWSIVWVYFTWMKRLQSTPTEKIHS